jgi:hypothetical protein
MLKFSQLFDMKRIRNRETAGRKTGRDGALRRPLNEHLASRITNTAFRIMFSGNTFH